MDKADMAALQKAELARDRRKKAIQAGATRAAVARLLIIEAAAVTEAAAVLGGK